MIQAVRHALLSQFVTTMERIAPVALADKSWDNVGLLLESPEVRRVGPRSVCRVLVTIDLSEAVFQEAVEREASIILAYHPPWFRAEKSLTLESGRGILALVGMCASRGISIYSPHSSLDAIPGGMNDRVAEVLAEGAQGVNACTPLQVSSVREDAGVGRLLTLAQPATIRDIIRRWTRYTGIPGLRLALSREHTVESVVRRIAICVGSGASVLGGVPADVYFTGEMSHSEILKAHMTMGATVILTEHTNCERGYLRDVLEPRLRRELPEQDFEVIVSTRDRDPVEIIIVGE